MYTGQPNPFATTLTRARYQRLAPYYDRMLFLSERRFRPWRARLWSRVKGPRVLELGVGTGHNLPFYPQGMQITAIDLVPAMLEHARIKANTLGSGYHLQNQMVSRLGVEVDLRLGDAQALDFLRGSFDTVVTACVFCSVPDPVLGLSEVRRVLRPGGQALLMEHVRSKQPLMSALMDAANPLVVRVMVANINRRTVENVRKAWSGYHLTL
jgi:ubiquinone/menaquinone biosynthesis C-methylase UbiE